MADVTENSSRTEKILGQATGDFDGEYEAPQSRIEALLVSLLAMNQVKINFNVTDLNEAFTSIGKKGILTIKGYAKTAANSPVNNIAGVVISITNGDSAVYGSQISFGDGGAYFRIVSGGTFGDWQKLASGTNSSN